jgi:Spy/CpxP family protein refolding chaperone
MDGRHEMRGGMECHDQKGMGHGQWWENPMVVKELGLSDKQAEQIDQLSLTHRKNVIKLEADLKIAEIEFRDMMEGEPSEADVRKKAKTLSQLREKLQDLRIDHMLAVRKVLTPEQQKKLQDMKPGRQQHRMMMEKGCQGMPCAPNPPEAPEAPKAPR